MSKLDIDVIESRWTGLISSGLTVSGLLFAAEQDIPDLIAYVRELEQTVEFTREWWATRIERLNKMARDEFPEDLRHRYFNVVANGTADVMEPPTYAQQMNSLKHKLEAAIKALKPFADAFRAVEASNTATDKDEPGYQKFLDQNTLTPAGATMGHFRKALEFMKVWVGNEAAEQVQSEMATLRATVARLEAKCRQQQQEMMAIQTELSRSGVQ